jgi:hypothetical protein
VFYSRVLGLYLSLMENRAIPMRHTIYRGVLGTVLGIVGVLLGSCAGLGVPQQPRLQVPESSLAVSPHSTLLPSSVTTLNRRSDGALLLGRPSSNAVEKWAHDNQPPDSAGTLVQLHDALLPFLAPACEITLDGDQ